MSDNAYQLIRYTNNDVMRKIELALVDPLCKTLFSGIVDSVSTRYRYNPLDVETWVTHGVHSYTLKPAVAETIWLPLLRLAQLVHCAAYDYNPYATRLPLPNAIPLGRLVEINTEAPELSITLARPIINPLLKHFSSIRLLRNCIVLVQEAIERGLEWIGRALEATLERGKDCSWNWGAYWGIQRDEFLERVEGAMVRKAQVSYARIEEIKTEDGEGAMILHPTESSLAKHIEEVSKGRIMVSSQPNTFNIDFDLEDSSSNEFLSLFA
ncbi:hypothetical protein H0H93_014479 [Arthromyces matolae]|nr:hypothetical protein H0H93_014479 [Arthromyces matolae]